MLTMSIMSRRRPFGTLCLAFDDKLTNFVINGSKIENRIKGSAPIREIFQLSGLSVTSLHSSAPLSRGWLLMYNTNFLLDLACLNRIGNMSRICWRSETDTGIVAY